MRIEAQDREQARISIRDLEDAITEVYLNYIDLDKNLSLEFTLGQLTILRDLAVSISANATVTVADEAIHHCCALSGDKRKLLHGTTLPERDAV